MPSFTQPIHEFNPCHAPGGSPAGGQFCSKKDFTGGFPGQEDREGWQTYWQREKDWSQRMEHAVALGKIEPKDAEQLGWRGSSNATDKGYQTLPPVLFHVSTGYSDIARVGLKTRSEIGGVHRGLGGGEDDTISFTSDLGTARTIRTAILEARRVARGELTPETMLRMAKAQPKGAPKRSSYGAGDQRDAYEMLVSFYKGDSSWRRGQPLPDNLQRLIDGVVVEPVSQSKHPDVVAALKQGGKLGGALPVKAVPAGMEPVGTFAGRDESFTTGIKRKMSAEERLDGAWEMYRRFATAREYGGGRIDPMFFMTDPKALAKVKTSDIRILQFKPANAKAKGYQVSALGEWRVKTGRAVKFTGLAESS